MPGRPKAAALAILALLAAGCQAQQQTTPGDGPPQKLEMASAFGSKLTVLGTQGVRFEQKFNRQSDDLRFLFYEPGKLFPPLESLKRVGDDPGTALWTTPGYHANENLAFTVFGGLPFGPPPRKHLEWLREGGGQTLMDAIFARSNIKAVPCSYMDAEGFGWFREPLESVSHLQGLRMRFFGLGAKVMERGGAETVLLAGGDIYPALRDGTIDATEFSAPYIDLTIGFPEIVEHYYYPGWHQPFSLLTLMVNLDTWNRLESEQRRLITATCDENIEAGLQQIDRLLAGAMQELEAADVSVRPTPPGIEARLREIWQAYARELGDENADFARAYESLRSFQQGG